MQLSIVGCPERKKFLKYVKEAVNFYAEELISKKLSENINLKIKFNKTLDCFGYACIKEFNNSGKAREFEIQIHPGIGAYNILKTLAHEMVHIKQFAYGETNCTLTRWKGNKVDSDDIDYYSHPWEIEANGMEVGLFTRYITLYELWNVFDITNPDDPIKPQKLGWKK